VIHAALQGLFGSSPSLRPADLVALLELLHELSVTIGAAVVDPAARSYLGDIKSGKSGKLAQALLSLTTKDHQAHLNLAAAQALTTRVERAERWARLRDG
jgi:hypothetical protein